jgi:hypothetical protein
MTATTERTLSFNRAARRLTITVTRKGRAVATDYLVHEDDGCQFGRAFSVTKLDGDGEPVESYAVNVGAGCESCECLDFLSRHRECKHIAAVRKLFAVEVLR